MFRKLRQHIQSVTEVVAESTLAKAKDLVKSMGSARWEELPADAWPRSLKTSCDQAELRSFTQGRGVYHPTNLKRSIDVS